MALPEYEQRKLDEIEYFFTREDGELARRLSGGRTMTTRSILWVSGGVLMLLSAGLVVACVGIELSITALVLLGAVLVGLVPLLIGWYLDTHRRRHRNR